MSRYRHFILTRFSLAMLAIFTVWAVVGCAWLCAGKAVAGESPAKTDTIESDYFKARLALAEGQTQLARELLDRCLAEENCPPQVYALAGEIRQRAGDTKGAFELIDKGLVKAPQSIDLLARRAVMLAQGGKIAEAVQTLEGALKIQPHRQDILELLSNLHLQRLRDVRSEAELKTEIVALIGVYEKMLETRRGVERLAPLLVLNSLYLRTQQPQRALDLAREAVELDPREVRCYLAVGAAQEALGLADQARATYRRALLADPDNKEVLGRIESLFADAPNPEARLAFYRDFANEYPRDRGIQQLYVQALIEARRWQDAEVVIRHNLELWPGDLDNRVAEVRVLVEMNRVDDLVALAKRLENENDDKTPLLILSVAQALVVKDRRAEALSLLEKHQSEFAGNENMILAQASLLVDNQQFDRARGLLEKYHADNPEAYLPTLMLTEIYVDQKNYDAAHALLDHLPERVRAKNEADILHMRAQIYQRQKQWDKALEIYNELTRRFDTNAQYFLEAAMAYQEAGRLTEAEKGYRHALELDPEDPEVNNALGYFYAETNQKLDEALTLVRKAMTLNPKAGHIVDSLGWVLFRQGKFKDAVSSLEEAVRLMKDSPDPVVYEHLGDALEKAGDTAKAREAWRKALDLDKDSAALKEKVGRYKTK
ncbi:MAG: tetratricopeptide repeat protein [bacterium]|nr:tetratricopeptide repeat protein [bacterium]